MLGNISEERRPHFERAGSLKSRVTHEYSINSFIMYSHKVKLRDVTQEHCERPAAVSVGIFLARNSSMPRLRWEDIKMDLQATGWRVWIGFIWLRTGTSGRLL
jgi:hypothetical protein